MKDYQNMKVKELREESRKKGLTLEHKGHKFTKAELITRLKQADDIESDIQKAIDEAGEECNNVSRETKQAEQNNDMILDIDYIENKYSKEHRRNELLKFLIVGSRIVYIDKVRAMDGKQYKKMRISAVVGINRVRKLVIVCTSWGKMLNVPFDSILYVKNGDERYPNDIFAYMDKQRRENEERERAKDQRGRKSYERVGYYTN